MLLKYNLFSLLSALLLLLVSSFGLHAQAAVKPKFDERFLNSPRQFAKEIEKQFKTIEIDSFKGYKSPRVVTLSNGYADAKIKNPQSWRKGRTDITVKQIDVVYTKFPKNIDFWITNYHELLANRLKELFKIDPSLNDASIEFRIVLQTKCETIEQTEKYFHGIIIKFDPVNTTAGIGTTGTANTTGPSGSKVSPGVTGATGYSGTKGTTGVTGATGYSGTKGTTGSVPGKTQPAKKRS